MFNLSNLNTKRLLCDKPRTSILAVALPILSAASVLSEAQLNLDAPFNDGERWVASTYSGHTTVGTFMAVDFNRESGLPEREIRATHSGYATYYYGPTTYGNYVKIVNGNGVTTLLGHLATKHFAGTRWVNAGDVVGYCGSTGNATGVHLHVEVFYNGVRQDVRNVLFDDQRIAFNSALQGSTITALRNYTVEGQMAKPINRPEVYYRVGNARWWVPDQRNVDFFGGWGNVYLTREDALFSLPYATPSKNTMYRQISSTPVFVQDPLNRRGRYWVQSAWGVDLLGGWDKVRLVPDRSFSLWDYVDFIF